jgi:hypothetical protein
LQARRLALNSASRSITIAASSAPNAGKPVRMVVAAKSAIASTSAKRTNVQSSSAGRTESCASTATASIPTRIALQMHPIQVNARVRWSMSTNADMEASTAAWRHRPEHGSHARVRQTIARNSDLTKTSSASRSQGAPVPSRPRSEKLVAQLRPNLRRPSCKPRGTKRARAVLSPRSAFTPDGAAGSIFEALSNLKCTIDPNEVKQKSGGGAECQYAPAN